MTFITTIQCLQKRNKALREMISDLEEMSAKQSDEFYKAQLRIRWLENENAALRMEKASLIYDKSKLEFMGGDGSDAK